MPFTGTVRNTLYGVVALFAVLVIVGVFVAWCVPDASAAPPATVEVTAPAPAPAPSPTSSTTSSTSTSTTSTSTSTSTSTTVKPKPVTTTVKPRAAAPATTPATAPRVTTAPPVALAGNFTPQERCANARQWVAEHGLVLPAGWGYRCPGQAVENGTPRWGLACDNCAGDGQSWIAVDIGRIGASDKALRYVVAHEICHAIDYMTLGGSSEVGADLCASLHGAPRP